MKIERKSIIGLLLIVICMAISIGIVSLLPQSAVYANESSGDEASVTYNNSTTKYNSFIDAWTDAQGLVTSNDNQATITLGRDVSVDSDIVNNGNIVLDTNGKTLTFTQNTTTSRITNNDGSLTITGGGVITGLIIRDVSYGVLDVSSGIVTVQNANIINNGYTSSNAVVINGGDFYFKGGLLKSSGQFSLFLRGAGSNAYLYYGTLETSIVYVVGCGSNYMRYTYIMPSDGQKLIFKNFASDKIFYYLPNTDNVNITELKYGLNADGSDAITSETNIMDTTANESKYLSIKSIEKFTIFYESNGGSDIENSTYTVESETITLPTPTKTGYIFAGWYDNAEFSGNIVTEIPQGSTGYKTFYAKWTPEKYNVTHKLTNISATEETAGEGKATYNTAYSTTLSVEDNYNLPETITIKVGEIELESTKYTYSNIDGIITIPAQYVTGDIEIIASGILVEFSWTWKDNLPSGITYDTVTGIKFLSTVPSGYKYSGKNFNGIDIYVSDTNGNDIAYVSSYTIKASSNSNELFKNCSSLITIDFSNFDTSNVTNMSSMFVNCYELTTLDLSGFNTAKVTNMYNMFCHCEALTTLNLSGFNTGLVKIMSYMFCHCEALTTLDLSGFNTAKVTTMQYMFSNCTALNGSFDLGGDAIKIGSNFTTAAVTNMLGMFSNCSQLTSIDLSGFNTELVEDMSLLFNNCTSLNGSFGLGGSTIKIGSNFTTAAVTNMNYMFSNCSQLTSIDLSRFNTDLVTDMSGMFSGCKVLTSLDLSGFDMTLVNSIDFMLDSCSNLYQIIAPKNLQIGVKIDLRATYDYTKGSVTDINKSTITSTTCSDGDNIAIYNKVFSVIFVLENGSFETSYIRPRTYTYDTILTLPTSNNISRTGYTFNGWYEDSNYSGSAITAITQGSTKDKIFYAKWTHTEYTIIFENGDNIISSEKYYYGDSVTLPTTPTKESTIDKVYTFSGWKLYDSGNLLTTIPNVTCDATYVAQLKESVRKYTITFIVNGEETINQVEYGSVPTAPTNPTKANYKFVGWDSEIEAVTGDKTYTAKFIEVGTIYDIRFYQPQVWDCQRSPAFPIANRSFRISGLKTAYDENLNKVNWADGDYIKFTKVYSKVSDILDETIKNRIISSLIRYTNCTREDISNAIVVKETLYNSDGTVKQELSSYGLIWALEDMGFLYTALNGSLSYSGGVGTYVTFKAQNSNNILIDIPKHNKPIDEEDDNDTDYVINDTTDISQAYIYFGGQVIDENKQALSGITVTLTYSGETYTFTTDSNGNFISDAIALVEDNTSYTIKITDGTHANVVYTRTIDSYGYGNDINNQVATSNEIYIYTSPTVEENGKDFTYTINFEKLGDYGAISNDTLQVSYGSIITINGNKIVINGQEIIATANAKDLIYEYSFVKWIIGEEQADERMVITNDLTIKAEFTRINIEYTIIFKNGDTELSKKTNYFYNSIIVVPTETPTKASTVDKDFTFIGWKLDNAGELLTTIPNVTGDATYVAQFSESVRKYTITFIVNGEETSNQVEYGSVPTAPTNLEKASTVDKDFTFIGWKLDNAGELLTTIRNVTGDATYVAQFSESVRKYTITFIVNGEETTNQVEYGELPTAPTNLAKASDDTYTYTFSGWDNKIVEVASNATYTAEFISKPKKISSVVDSTNPEDEDKVNCEIESEKGLDADSVIVLKVIKKDTISSDIVLPDNMEFLNTYNVQLLLNEVEITPNEELTIKFAKPVGLKDLDTYKIVLFENGETVEKIARVDGNYLVFKTSVLGDFAIVGETENEEAINLLWLIILLSVLTGLELIAIGALLKRNADEKNKVKSNRTYSFVGLPLMILTATFMKSQLVAIIILSAMVVSLGVIIVLLAIKTYNQKQNTEDYKEENVEKLKQVIDNAKLLATTKVNISKKAIADYLENNYKDRVVVNRRENYTSTGLPLADTHYLASKKKKECFIYVYELKDNKMFLLLKIDNVLSGQIAKKHKNINLSKFPKSKDSWYSLIIDDSFDSANDLFKILDKILYSYNV